MPAALRLSALLAILLFLGSALAVPAGVNSNELRRGRRGTVTLNSPNLAVRQVIAQRQYNPRQKRQTMDCPAAPQPSGRCTQTCPTGGVPQTDGSCRCASGAIVQPGGTCIPTNCPTGSTGQTTGLCLCSGGAIVAPGGSCTTPATCPSGSTLQQNGSCLCPGGATVAPGATCPSCPSGSTTQSNGSCLCPGGSTVAPGATCPTNCPTGSTANGSGACTCQSGTTVQPGGSCAPTNCPANTTPQNTGFCLCADGTSNILPGGTCPNTTPTSCPTGFTVTNGVCTCSGVLVPVIGTGSTNANNICLTTGCPPGTYLPTGSNTCVTCADPNATTCSPTGSTGCESGYTLDTSVTPNVCKPTTTSGCSGTLALQLPNGACVSACPAGTRVNPLDALQCIACATGLESILPGATATCNNDGTLTSCNSGLLNVPLYLDPVLNTCLTVCPNGSYANGALQCVLCGTNLNLPGCPAPNTNSQTNCITNALGIIINLNPLLGICV